MRESAFLESRCAFASTVAALAVVNTRLQESEDALMAEHERITQQLLQNSQPVASDFDPGLHELCERTVREVERCDDMAAVLTLPCLQQFEQDVGSVPPKLLKGDMCALRRYLSAQATRTSEAAAAERAARKAAEGARQAADSSAEFAAAKTAAEARQRGAAADARDALAQSDHMPIRVAATSVDGRALRVSSHNVQEHVRDGLGTYVCSLPFVSGTRGRGVSSRLIAAMMAPEVLRQQARAAELNPAPTRT